MFLTICLEQWYWIAGIASAVIAGVTVFLIWRYVKYTKQIAEQGERAYQSQITTRITETQVISDQGIPVPLGLAIRADLHLDIYILIVNISRGASRFYLRVESWFNSPSPLYYPVEPLYRGEEEFVSPAGERFVGHFFVDMSPELSRIIEAEVITELTDLRILVNYFTEHNLYVSTDVEYTDLPVRKPEPTCEYYFKPNGRPPYIVGDEGSVGYIYIPGQWVRGKVY